MFSIAFRSSRGKDRRAQCRLGPRNSGCCYISCGCFHSDRIFGARWSLFSILQWFTSHTMSIVLQAAFSKPVRWLSQTPVEWFTNPPQGNGFNLAVVYASWIAGVLLLYPLCKWFAGVKARRKDWWLSYL